MKPEAAICSEPCTKEHSSTGEVKVPEDGQPGSIVGTQAKTPAKWVCGWAGGRRGWGGAFVQLSS